jgi:hypothetical protein
MKLAAQMMEKTEQQRDASRRSATEDAQVREELPTWDVDSDDEDLYSRF